MLNLDVIMCHEEIERYKGIKRKNGIKKCRNTQKYDPLSGSQNVEEEIINMIIPFLSM